MFEKEKQMHHETYGTLSVCRAQGGSHVLFGSSIKHNTYMTISLHTAHVSRELSNDFICPDKTLFEVDMSPSQWAEFVSSVGVGAGVPCTIRWRDGHRTEQCPFISKREQFDAEFDDTVQKSIESIQAAMKQAEGLLQKKSLTKADRENLLSEIQTAYNAISDAIPFIKQQFTEQMDRTVVEAKGEFEAWKDMNLHNLGVQSIQKLLESSNPELGDSLIDSSTDNQ